MRKLGEPVMLAVSVAIGIVTGPAQVTSAAPDDQAVCVAENISVAHSLLGGRDFAQLIVVPDAHGGGAGDTIAPNASTDCGAL
jgi:hypothetical protein